MLPIIIVFAAVNTLSFAVTAADKKKARRGQFRIRESTLFSLAFLGGACGVWLGMQLMRHKTKHKSFLIIIPILLTAQLLFLLFLWLKLTPPI